jgi:hypothetical protein
MIDIFIPSYHRPRNIKTATYFVGNGWNPKNVHVVIDSEADDRYDYQDECDRLGVNLHVFDIDEARERFDFVHRKSASRRSAGMARNEFYDIAKSLGIDFYCVIDDDTSGFQYRPFGVYKRKATIDQLRNAMDAVREFMQRQRIGMWGFSQTGDLFARYSEKLMRKKVMNTTFVNLRFMYRGERGVQDDDTSQFVSVMNEGYFTGSLAGGIILQQTSSATQKGGLTDLYNENKLLNKSVVVPIQYPSLAYAEKQKRNGGRLHHHITYRYLMPCLIKGKRSNIAWDCYPEDVPFSLEAKRDQVKNR